MRHPLMSSEANNRQARASLAVALATAAVMVLCVTGLNWILDPNGLSCSEHWPRFDQSKLPRVHHAHQVSCYQPRTLLVGSSRVFEGFLLENLSRRSYKIGISSMTPFEQGAYALHAAAVAPLEQVIAVVDVESFLHPLEHRGAFRQWRLSSVPGNPDPWRLPLDRLAVNASLDTSIGLLRGHLAGASTGEYMVETGDAFESKFHHQVRSMGDQTALTRRLAALTERVLQPAVAMGAEERARLLGKNLAHLRSWSDALVDAEIKVTVIIGPAHQLYLERIRSFGLMDDVDAFRTGIASLTARGIQVIDRFDLPGVSDEMVSEGDQWRSRYWWDVDHFRPEVGQLLLNELLTVPL